MKENSRHDHHEAMLRMIESFQGSGQTRKEFCTLQSIPLSKFYYWQKKYFQKQHQATESGFFIPVSASRRQGSISPSSQITLQYPNGVSLSLPLNTAPSVIRTLIRLI